MWVRSKISDGRARLAARRAERVLDGADVVAVVDRYRMPAVGLETLARNLR